MKKQNFKNLRLNKKTISKFDIKGIKGGTGGETTFAPGGCLQECPDDTAGPLTNDPNRPACDTIWCTAGCTAVCF